MAILLRATLDDLRRHGPERSEESPSEGPGVRRLYSLHPHERQPSSCSVAVALAAAFALAAVRTPAHGQQPLPQLSNAEFRRLMTDFAETSGNFHSDNFTSNENGAAFVAAELAARKPGGAYIGVGRLLDAEANDTPTTPSGSQGPGPIDATSSAPTPCPQITIDAVKAVGRPGNLVQVIYVEGSEQGGAGAEAWICRDSDDMLYYQGHDKNGPATAATTQRQLGIIR